MTYEITEFKDEFEWLSNFAPVKISLDGFIYPSVEHAYMSCKNDTVAWKVYCADASNSAGEVKKKSKTIELVRFWDDIRCEVMIKCLRKKFEDSYYRNLLIETKDWHLSEGNWWDDKYWGVCLKTNEGRNMLGRLIMQVRVEISEG